MFPALWGRDLKAHAESPSLRFWRRPSRSHSRACGGDDASKEQDAERAIRRLPGRGDQGEVPDRAATGPDLGSRSSGSRTPATSHCRSWRSRSRPTTASPTARSTSGSTIPPLSNPEPAGLDPREQVPAGHRRAGAEGGLRRPARPDQHLRLRPARPGRGEDDRLEVDRRGGRYLHSPLPASRRASTARRRPSPPTVARSRASSSSRSATRRRRRPSTTTGRSSPRRVT